MHTDVLAAFSISWVIVLLKEVALIIIVVDSVLPYLVTDLYVNLDRRW